MNDSNYRNINLLLQQAMWLFQQGNLIDAQNHVTELLKLSPEHAGGIQLLGGIKTHLGDYQAAVNLFSTAIDLSPGAPGNFNNLGYVLHMMGRLDEARQACLKAIKLKPDFSAAHNTLSVVLKDLRHLELALTTVQRAIQLTPDFSEAHYTLAAILIDMGRFDEALPVCRRALQLKPGFAEVYNLLAIILLQHSGFKEASAACEEGIRLRPDLAELHVTRANLLSEQGMMQTALVALNKVIEINPQQAISYYNRANVLSSLGRFVEAEKDYSQVLNLDPQHAEAHSNLLFTQASAAQLPYHEMLKQQQQWDIVHGQPGRLEKLPIRPKITMKTKTLRVGYVSADFCKHPVGYFFAPLLSGHDKSKVETFCYANMYEAQADTVTQRLRGIADHWRFVKNKNDGELARLIHKDKIDVLVDLAGHSRGNRLKVFTYRPAPVQAMYLGYCASSGLRDMDYWITDEMMHPLDTPELSTEKIIRLPRCSFAYQPPHAADIVTSRNHNENGIVFASYSHFSKLLPVVIETWSKILLAVNGSRLMIMGKYMIEDKSRDIILEQFLLNGISEDRLIISGHLSYADYYASYSNVDIVLDPFPRTGGTTTVDSLWMGVPVITLVGSRYVERLSMCKLHTLGLDELVATDKKQYVDIAIRLAGDEIYRRDLRKNLRSRMMNSQLSDGSGLAIAMEEAYEKMWGEWIRNES